MIVIEIIGTCRTHDVQERVQMRGKDTPRQLEEGYTELDRKMGRHGCTDYSKIHSVTKQPKDHLLPYLFQPRYPQPAQPAERSFDREYGSEWPETES